MMQIKLDYFREKKLEGKLELCTIGNKRVIFDIQRTNRNLWQSYVDLKSST